MVAGGERHRIAIDPDGRYALSGTEADVYRIEVEAVSAAIAGAERLEFGRQDSLEQIAANEAVRASTETGKPIRL